MKKILLIDHYLPQPDRDAGSKTIYQFLIGLIELGYACTFVPDNFHKDENYAPLLLNAGVEIIFDKLTYDSLCLSDFDYIFISRPHIYKKYIDDIRRRSSVKVVYYGHDIHHLRMIDMVPFRDNKVGFLDEIEYWKHLEIYAWETADAVLYPSEVEVEFVNKYLALKKMRIRAARITPYFYDLKRDEYLPEGREGILFVAGFAHPPNVDAANYLVNEICKDRSILRGESIYLVGSNPSDKVQKLANNWINVTGYVSDAELMGFYKSCRAAVVPLQYGGGIKNKVIEAMASGIPLITGEVGIQGLKSLSEIVLFSQNLEDYIANIKHIYSEHSNLSSLVDAQYQFIGSFFSKNKMKSELTEIFR